MVYDFLVDYFNSSGEFRTYGGLGHMLIARDQNDAIEQVKSRMPPQVLKTWTQIRVAGKSA